MGLRRIFVPIDDHFVSESRQKCVEEYKEFKNVIDAG